MSVKSAILILALSVGLIPPSALAVEPGTRLSERLIGDELVKKVRSFLASDVVTLSLRGANDARMDFSQAQIEDLDTRWRVERERPFHPLVASALSSPLSIYLTRVQAHSEGLFTEIIVVDGKGLNVGQSSVTSDMWQGDEAKFLKTYAVGANAVFIDAAEWHEPSGTWRSQLNLTIDDPETGRPLGAATVEVNLTELNRRIAR